MMRAFDCFVGIDWSGARGPYQPGLAVFMAEAGKKPRNASCRQTVNTGAARPLSTGWKAYLQKGAFWPVSILPLPIRL